MSINWDARTVRIRQGKTGNYKVIGPLGQTSMEILREFYNASKTDLVRIIASAHNGSKRLDTSVIERGKQIFILSSHQS